MKVPMARRTASGMSIGHSGTVECGHFGKGKGGGIDVRQGEQPPRSLSQSKLKINERFKAEGV